jgi:glucosamine--fructose-6-phosphate aminotransferase (isomerizing)
MSQRPSASASLMLQETREAPEAVARLLAENVALCKSLGARLRSLAPPFAVSCARGSSDAAATYAKYLLEIRLGLVTASVGPSIRSVYAAPLRMKGALFFAVSQSGRSPDLIHLAQAARAGGALTLAFLNEPASPLAEACEITVPVRAGPERSVAATKSFICSLAAILQLIAHWANDRELLNSVDRLPEALARAVGEDWSAAVEVLGEAQSLLVLGRGVGLALAQEAALKLKEVCGLHAEAMSAAELMHGPLTLPGADFPVLVFSQQDEAYQSIADVVAALSLRDVPILAAGPAQGGTALALPCDLSLNPVLMPIALIQSFYPLAEAVARARGRDPDNPPHLKKVTETV